MVTIEHGAITSVDEQALPASAAPGTKGDGAPIDLGDHIVAPAFINAHTHLRWAHSEACWARMIWPGTWSRIFSFDSRAG